VSPAPNLFISVQLRTIHSTYIFCSFTHRDDAMHVMRQRIAAVAASAPAAAPPPPHPALQHPAASAAADSAPDGENPPLAGEPLPLAPRDRPSSPKSNDNPHVVAVFVCAYGKTAVTLGHWYLHPGRICFFSGVPRTFIEIPLASVRSIQKTNTAFIFRTAIEIHCAQGALFFGSFTSRHAAFMHVVQLLRGLHGDSLHVISDSNSCPTIASVPHPRTPKHHTSTFFPLIHTSTFFPLIVPFRSPSPTPIPPLPRPCPLCPPPGRLPQTPPPSRSKVRCLRA
jgi:hypothetical protein